MINKHIASQLSQFGSASIYEAQGAIGALDSGIKPLSDSMQVYGPAFTVDIHPGDNLMLHYALLHIQPGDVLVVDAKRFIEAGPWGDILTEQAITKGVAGLIINGSVRDAQAIKTLGFPVFCRGLSIKGTAKKQSGKINVPICIGDAVINPGDYIFGDEDGVVAVSPQNLAAVLQATKERENTEAIYREEIKQGSNTVDLLGLRDTLIKLNLA
ncbi:4-carboxy-4-hydroxy-2-oxoadipate aldolase/oxaloacetate decarboxylase [Halomonas sp. MC140]|nr:4-carboxy-4-hydroxy-2-oxoadipate aldolase/oxaloacetate decarboxylase [Halomonas sp. MC140]MDN7133521.1 4-carboxy-4-hydroxy-2-oxoadipate aldolase/oxaloacetate decarboxylase [Halomonas sp. MC140]